MPEACRQLSVEMFREPIEKIGGDFVGRRVDFGDGATRTEFQSIDLGGVQVVPSKINHLDNLGHMIDEDEAGFRSFYAQMDLPSEESSMKAAVLALFSLKLGNRNLWSVMREDNVIGFFQTTLNDKNGTARISPYCTKEERGNGSFKNAYLALAHVLDKNYGYRVEEGYTLPTNKGMKSLFTALGLQKFNDAPCSVPRYKMECDIYQMPSADPA